MEDGKQWTIIIESWGGFVPAFFENSYPFYGNKNQASNMKNVDMIDPNVLTQGPGTANLTNGDENGAVTTLIKGILRTAVSNNVSYAIGGAKLYRIAAGTVSNAGDWPHTINKAVVTGEDGEDVLYYKSYLYYFYNHSGGGSIGRYNLASTFDDDWASTFSALTLSEDFEANNWDNWDSVDGEWTIQDSVKHAGTYAAKGDGSTGPGKITRNFLLPVKTMTTTFYVRFAEANKHHYPFYPSNDSGKDVYVLCAANNGHWKYYNGSSYNNLPTDATYIANTWYKIQIDYNAELSGNGSYDIYIDDVKKSDTGISFLEVKPLVNFRMLNTNSTGTGTMYVDDITYTISEYAETDWYGTLENAPHQAMTGGDDDAYFTNGRYVGAIRANGTLELQAIDFWENSEVVSLAWNWNRVIIAVNRPNITGSNFNQSGVYTWNGTSSSWEGDPIEVSGKIGALYTKNGVTYIWWQDGTDTGAYVFGYVSEGRVEPIKRYKGSLPLYYQVGEYKGFLAWVGGSYIYVWGSKDVEVPVNYFQYIAGQQATIGGIATPFGDLLIASYASTNFSLAKPSGYTVDCNWKSKAFKISGVNFRSQIDSVKIKTEQLTSGAKVDCTLTYDQAKSTKALTQIAYSTANKISHKILDKGPQVDDFRLDIDWANGSVSNPVKIRAIEIVGHYVKYN